MLRCRITVLIDVNPTVFVIWVLIDSQGSLLSTEISSGGGMDKLLLSKIVYNTFTVPLQFLTSFILVTSCNILCNILKTSIKDFFCMC